MSENTKDLIELVAKKTSYVAILALITLITYCSVAIYAVYQGTIDFKEFSAVLGPITGMLIGYLIRDREGS